VDLFRLFAGKKVVNTAQISAKSDVEAGFFQDFPLGGFWHCLTRVTFALGEGNIFVLGSINQENPHFVIDDLPTDCSAGDHRLRG
jgi:hypothetical protein